MIERKRQREEESEENRGHTTEALQPGHTVLPLGIVKTPVGGV